MDKGKIKPLNYDKIHLVEKALKERFDTVTKEIQLQLDEAGITQPLTSFIRFTPTDKGFFIVGIIPPIPDWLKEVVKENYAEVHNEIVNSITQHL